MIRLAIHPLSLPTYAVWEGLRSYPVQCRCTVPMQDVAFPHVARRASVKVRVVDGREARLAVMQEVTDLFFIHLNHNLDLMLVFAGVVVRCFPFFLMLSFSA